MIFNADIFSKSQKIILVFSNKLDLATNLDDQRVAEIDSITVS